jgi:hypothetical protein
LPGVNNRIGAVFSDDGIFWTGRTMSYNPVTKPVSCAP